MFRHGARFFTFALFLSLSGPGIASEVAPDFNLRSPEGRRIHLKTFLQDGPVLLDFWATYCKPCIKAMPKLSEIHRKYKSRGLTVMGVNEDGPRSQTKVKPFMAARKIRFPVVLDLDGSVMRRMQVASLPATYLIAQDGEIVLQQKGYSENTSQELLAAIESLLPENEDGEE